MTPTRPDGHPLPSDGRGQREGIFAFLGRFVGSLGGGRSLSLPFPLQNIKEQARGRLTNSILPRFHGNANFIFRLNLSQKTLKTQNRKGEGFPAETGFDERRNLQGAPVAAGIEGCAGVNQPGKSAARRSRSHSAEPELKIYH